MRRFFTLEALVLVGGFSIMGLVIASIFYDFSVEARTKECREEMKGSPIIGRRGDYRGCILPPLQQR
jgi:hypothetical protein